MSDRGRLKFEFSIACVGYREHPAPFLSNFLEKIENIIVSNEKHREDAKRQFLACLEKYVSYLCQYWLLLKQPTKLPTDDPQFHAVAKQLFLILEKIYTTRNAFEELLRTKEHLDENVASAIWIIKNVTDDIQGDHLCQESIIMKILSLIITDARNGTNNISKYIYEAINTNAWYKDREYRENSFRIIGLLISFVNKILKNSSVTNGYKLERSATT